MDFLKKEKKEQDLLFKESQKMENISLEKEKDSFLEEKQEQDLTQSIEQQVSVEGVQEVTKEDGVREMKGEVPAGPKYIGFDKKFTKIEEGDSERMIKVREALAEYHSKDRALSDEGALERLIRACDEYCKGRFAFFKAFRKAGQRLAEVKALRAEAQRLLAPFVATKSVELIYEESSVKKSRWFIGTSKKTKLKSKTYLEEEKMEKQDALMTTKEGFDDTSAGYFDEEAEYDNEEFLAAEKQKLIDAYKEEKPDPDLIGKLEKDIRVRTERAYKFKDYLAEHHPKSKFMDNQWDLDAQLAKYRIPYQNAISKERIKKEAGTEAFKQELEQLAMENYTMDTHLTDAKVKNRDNPYNEEELKETLEQFESFDMNQISFSNHLDMLKNYGQNMAIFEHIRKVHYQLMKGLIQGFRIDDERLIKLRAKFTASFEMQNYLVRVNELAFRKKLDLTQPEDELAEKLSKEMDDNRSFRIAPVLGDADAFVAKCEQKHREEYEKREEFIPEILRAMEHDGDENAEIPEKEIRKRMQGYERNSAIYDYLNRKHNRVLQNKNWDRVKTYNKEHGTDIPENNASIMTRIHGNFMVGKSNEEIARLTKLNYGGPEERIQYCLEMIKDIKAIDLKELDTRNLGKFYQDFERKDYIMQLGTNSQELANVVIGALEELRKDADTPLELPQEFKDLGYKTVADFKKDMYVLAEVINTVQLKMDAVVQAENFGYLGMYSLEELLNIDTAQYQKMESSYDAYYEKAERAYEEEKGESYTTETGTVEGFLESFKTRIFTLNAPRKLTEADKAAGKKAENYVASVNIMTILKNEQAIYDEKLKEGKI